MTLDAWAARHAVTPAALAELRVLLVHGESPFPPTVPTAKGSEAWVQSAVRLEAAQAGVRLYRNNVGASIDAHGRLVRYGLANESAAQNERIKSSDLIGIRPVTLDLADGTTRTIGQFVARECKASDWSGTPRTERELAQARFLNIITACGGDAAFASSEGTI